MRTQRLIKTIRKESPCTSRGLFSSDPKYSILILIIIIALINKKNATYIEHNNTWKKWGRKRTDNAMLTSFQSNYNELSVTYSCNCHERTHGVWKALHVQWAELFLESLTLILWPVHVTFLVHAVFLCAC